MDFMPPSRVVKVSDPRWSRFVIRDSIGQYWANERWSDNPSDAVLFHRETDAIEARNRLGFSGDAADTFVTTIVLSTHHGEWTAEELTAYLQRHRRSFMKGPTGKKGILLEIVPDGVKKMERLAEDNDGSV